MISEKYKKIVASVFATKGVFPHDEDEEMSQIIMAKKEFDGYSVGEFQGGNGVRTNGYWEYICTIEEYNRCIEDMARAEWLSGSIHRNYYFYKVECKNKGIDTSNNELLARHCIYDKPSSAERTLINMGYRDCGGELWKPPLGRAPDFIDKPLVYTQGDFKKKGGLIEGMLFATSHGQFVAKSVNEKSVCYENENGYLEVCSIGCCAPVPTLEQIKQGKLDAHLKCVVDAIVENHEANHWNYSRSALYSDVKKVHELGYIVEPK